VDLFHVSKNGVQSGPLTREQIAAALQSRELATTDFYWKEGMTEWQPLEGVTNNAVTAVFEENRHYAGFWIRVQAIIADGIVLIVPVLTIEYAFGWGLFGPNAPLGRMLRGQSLDHANIQEDSGLQAFLMTLLIMLYEVGMTASPWQGTIGKKWSGIKVIDYQGKRLSWQRSLARWFAKAVWGRLDNFAQLIPSVAFVAEKLAWLGLPECLIAAFTSKKQAIHDYLAKTYVIYEERKPTS